MSGAAPRRVPVFFALLFYGFLAACGLVWIHFTRPGAIVSQWAWGPGAPLHLAIGLAAAALFALASALTTRVFAPARDLESEFARMTADHGVGEILLLALVSGAAEELFFRGAMQPHLGLAATSLLFGAVHWPITRKHLAWPFFAAVAGVILGLEFQLTGDRLLAPVATHAGVNFLHLWRIRRRYPPSTGWEVPKAPLPEGTHGPV